MSHHACTACDTRNWMATPRIAGGFAPIGASCHLAVESEACTPWCTPSRGIGGVSRDVRVRHGRERHGRWKHSH